MTGFLKRALWLNLRHLWLFVLLLGVGCVLSAPVQALNLDSSDVIFAVQGVDTSSHIGESINCVGDVNGDGFSDIAVSSWSPLGTYIFFGGNPPDTIPDMFLRGVNGPPTSIDINGDGINDILLTDEVGPLAGEVGTILIYRGYGDSLSSEPVDSIPCDSANWAFGYWFKAEDINGDGFGDILTTKPNRPTGRQLLLFYGAPTLDTTADWVFSTPDAVRNFYNYFGFIDFNGDGEQDIFLGFSPGRDTAGYVGIFLGPNFGETPDVLMDYPLDITLENPRYYPDFVANVGDFNGDGWDDLVVHFSAYQLVYFCGPAADTVYDYKLEFGAQWTAGKMDVNGDGFNDIVAGGAHYMYGSVELYLGGPRADQTRDDFFFTGDLPPWFIERLGYRTSRAGDFNGDGIDDFLFSSQNFAFGHWGAVFVAKGSRDIVVDVPLDTSQTSADSSFEFTSYPNPFNSTVSLSFALPARSDVTLAVFDITGRLVRTVFSGELGSGPHTMQWDGRSKDSREAASGVYLCRLVVGGQSACVKAVMVK